MSVVSEIDVDIPRAERNNEHIIESFRQHLLNHYPEIQTLM